MADDFRRRIRWERKQKLRKRREEKDEDWKHNESSPRRYNQFGCSSISNDKFENDFIESKTAPRPIPARYSLNTSMDSTQSTEIPNSSMEGSGPLFTPPLKHHKNSKDQFASPVRLEGSDDDELIRDALLLAQRKNDQNQSAQRSPPGHPSGEHMLSNHAVMAKSVNSSDGSDSDSDDLLRDALFLKEKRESDAKRVQKELNHGDGMGASLPCREIPEINAKKGFQYKFHHSQIIKGTMTLNAPEESEPCREILCSKSDGDKFQCSENVEDVLKLRSCEYNTNRLREKLECSEGVELTEQKRFVNRQIHNDNSPTSSEVPLQKNGEIVQDVPPSPQNNPVTADSLWSDSDSELPKVEEKIVKSRKRQRPKSSNDSNGLPTRTARVSDHRLRPSPQRLKSDNHDMFFETNDDNIDVNKLIPHFEDPKLGPPADLVPFIMKYSRGERIVPAAINRYLKGYQREGIVFMHNRISLHKGVILALYPIGGRGDDMGLGKTVQVISLLAALLMKKGCGEDDLQLQKRRRVISQKLEEERRRQEQALRCGNVIEQIGNVDGLFISEWAPILIVVPPSIIENWMNEFKAWGHFGVIAFTGPSRDIALYRIRNGLEEIMLCGRSMLQNDDDLSSIIEIKWKLAVIDEYHQYKNFRTKLYSGLKLLRDTCDVPLVGLTGTLMQNNHEELWSEVDLVNPGFLGTWEEFKDDTSVPIKLGRTKTADDAAVEEGNQVRDWLKTKLKSFFLQRRKIDVLKDDLPVKNERVVFCELSPLQKRLYQHMMTLPDVVLVKYGNAPCECGINQAIFQGFKHMKTDREKIAYQRNHRDDIIPRKSCCHKRPLNFFRFNIDEEFYDPRAPLWRWQHERLVNGEVDAGSECKSCPYCISFAVLDKLYKLSSHVSLLQVPKHPNEYVEGSRLWKEAQKALDFAKVAFPEDVMDFLPGGSYIREDGIMDDHSNLSGKMKMLSDLLCEFNRRDDRLLIFSFSTQTLDLIQNFVRAQGYSFLRLDGSTPTKCRQGLVDKYQQDKNIFLFLISTKAGGLGLNLTAANVVIVFDVDFNPSNDEQSQDRAYRIGQKRDVLVIRLVSRGTIEELKYIRQLYKLQLKNYTIGSVQSERMPDQAEAARMFRAVEGDKDRKGELFGMENLLKFKDGSFMDDLWKSKTKKSCNLKGLERFGLCSAIDMADQFEGMSEEGINDIGGNIVDAAFRQAALNASKNQKSSVRQVVSVESLLQGENARSHVDFLRADRGDALFKPGDHGYEVEMGGYSQAEHFVMENAELTDAYDPIDSSETSDVYPLASNAMNNAAPSPVRSAQVSVRHVGALEGPDEALALPVVAPKQPFHQSRCVPLPPRGNPTEPNAHLTISALRTTSSKTLCFGRMGSSVFSSKDLYIPDKMRKKKKSSGQGSTKA